MNSNFVFVRFTKSQKNRTFVENFIIMFGFVIIAVVTLCILVPCTYIRKAIQKRQTTKKKQTRRNNRVFSNTVSNNEMTEEQMIAEDYYYYQDKE